MKRYDLIVEQCDADIRAGRPAEAVKRLRDLNLARVPGPWRLPLAKICRRAGLHSTGLLLLSKLIHGNKAEVGAAELAEYGALLLRSGAISEAEQILNRADHAKAPEALLFRSYVHFIRWEFAKAIPLLEEYLKSDLAPYPKLVAQTNLAYALVETQQHEPALQLLEQIVETSGKDGHALLERNARCYRAQAYFQGGDPVRARKEVAVLQSQNAGPTNDELVVIKYQLLFEGIESKSLEPINRLRALAIRNRDSAAHREADLFSLKVKFNLERFLYLYFGTPFTAFRERITKELNFYPDRDTYVLGPKNSPRFDLRTGLIDGKPMLNPGHGCHQMIDVLLRDFYQPARVPALFSMLFQREHFEPNSSPDRVHQQIRRTRRWLEQSGFPIYINEDDGFYSLDISGKFSFRVPLNREMIEPQAIQFRQIQDAFAKAGTFSAREIREKLDLPKTTVFRLLKWADENGKVTRIEAGSNIVYKIAS